MESSNPVFSRGFPRAQQQATFNVATPGAGELQDMYSRPAYTAPRFMTLDDVVVRTASTLGVLLVAGAFAWALVPDTPSFGVLGLPLLIGAVLGLIIAFKGSTNPALILTYAGVEGVALGALSKYFNDVHPGIAMQAVIGTAGVFGGMLFVYKTGAIRVTPRFARCLTAALIGAVVLMLANLVASLFTDDGLHLRDGGTIAILFSLAMIAIASLSFLLDFDMVDKAIRQGAPERFAWYCAFGLTITLVWLYIEILRLLSYFRE